MGVGGIFVHRDRKCPVRACTGVTHGFEESGLTLRLIFVYWLAPHFGVRPFQDTPIVSVVQTMAKTWDLTFP